MTKVECPQTQTAISSAIFAIVRLKNLCGKLCGILVQVWYLIVSIPDLCQFSYFDGSHPCM